MMCLGMVFCVAATGCASSAFMHEAASAHSGPPPAGSATVVFLRPSNFGYATTPTILDQQGGFVGQSVASSQFAATVPAGKHMFVVWAENTGALQADLAPGKTYYVHVSLKMGALSARAHLLALKPASSDWGKLDDWLGTTTRYEVDQQAGQAYLAGRADEVQERLRRANEALQKYDRAELAERTLAPKDGR
jgi:hypothetical protein